MQYSNAFLDDQQFLTSSNCPFKGVFFISVYPLVLQQQFTFTKQCNGSRSNSSILLQGVYFLFVVVSHFVVTIHVQKVKHFVMVPSWKQDHVVSITKRWFFSEKSDNKHLSKISHFSNLCLTLVGILLHILMTPIHQLQQATTQPSALRAPPPKNHCLNFPFTSLNWREVL